MLCFFVALFYYFCFMLVFFILSHLFRATLWSDTGKGLTPGLLYVMFSCGFVPSHMVSMVSCASWIVSIRDLCLLAYFSLNFISFVQ